MLEQRVKSQEEPVLWIVGTFLTAYVMYMYVIKS